MIYLAAILALANIIFSAWLAERLIKQERDADSLAGRIGFEIRGLTADIERIEAQQSRFGDEARWLRAQAGKYKKHWQKLSEVFNDV